MKDLYTEITDRIIEQLEQGIIPWKKPWAGVRDGAISHATGKPYSLLNQFMLGKPGEYVTFHQCKEEGGRVKKGAKSKIAVFWKVIPHEKTDGDGAPVIDADGNKVIEGIPVLRYFQVFHIDDCEGIAPKWADNMPKKPAEPIQAADDTLMDYVRRENIQLELSITNDAYYSPSRDLIHLPIIEQYETASEYYSTSFHEATHSTGHKTRLNRFSGPDAIAAFGSESYSKEELVAELGAACILHDLGIETPQTFKNSAAYIQSWLNVLKNDKRMIISAAARAEKAVKMILNIKDEKQADGE